MSRQIFTLTLVLAVLAPAGVVWAGEPPRPNIVFILADDMGWGDLGVYGHRELRTPHLDALAGQGALFTQFYVNAPVCTPSRVAFLTGQFPGRLGFHSVIADHATNQAMNVPDWLDSEIPSITKLLQQAGYATGLFGKWHLGQLPGAPALDAYGIDDHRSVLSPLGGPTWVENAPFRALSTGFIVDEAIRFIEAHQNEPFFVNLWALLPHSNLAPTDEQMAPYAQYAPPWPFVGRGTKEIYYASVTAMDEQIGRLVARLDQLGLSENTIIMFASDNGPEDIVIPSVVHSGIGSSGPFRGRKRSLYEGGVRSPLIVRWPGHVTAGRVDDLSVVSAVDFMPTLLSLAGAEPPGSLALDGEDVSDILLGNPRPRTQPLFWEWRLMVIGDVVHRSPMLAVRDGDWKLLMNPDFSRVELYNLRQDPTEVDNLAASHPGIVESLSEELLQWAGTLPPGPVHVRAGKNDYPWPQCRVPADSDGDGIFDCNDGCPNDPLKTGPGICGCHAADVDGDGDGALNCVEGCPDDPAKLDPGACGCGVVDVDSDGDGTPDCIDPCPGDNPNDSDGDGVCDSADFCPGGNDQLNDDGDAIPNCVDNCPLTVNPDQADADGDQAGDLCDCGVADPGVFPDAWEINDGRDNQCPGDAGYGLIDETSGDSGFHDTGALIWRYSWLPQPGATLHEVARSESPLFTDCVLAAQPAYWDDIEQPPPNGVFHYLNRPLTPFAGSWGQDSTGAERLSVCSAATR